MKIGYINNTLLILTQAFIDTIRNSDNMNKQRLFTILIFEILRVF